MEKQIPFAEEPIGRLREPGQCWPGHCSGPGEAAESQQRFPGMYSMKMLYFPGLSGQALVSLSDLEPGCVTASTANAGPALRKWAANFVRTIFGNSEVENA